MSRMRSSEVSGRARRMMSSNWLGSTSRPGALTEYWKSVPGGEGGCPKVPAGFCRFCAWIALLTSVAVMPSLAILSGFTHTRME